jgi:transposase
LDVGTTFCWLEADAPRVECKQHGVVVAAVPWARHDTGFTRSFEDQTAWLAVNTSKSAICQLMRIAWRTVGRVCERVTAEAKRGRDLFANLERLGFDRVAERQRAVALARHYREAEGLSIAQIAVRLGRAPATVKGYFYDPTGEKARAVKARYVGVCRGCGAYTQPRNGKGDAYAYCKVCHRARSSDDGHASGCSRR